jgi:hypothetical protein
MPMEMDHIHHFKVADEKNLNCHGKNAMVQS